nr:hypothetical protein [Brevundimonas diminuta]
MFAVNPGVLAAGAAVDGYERWRTHIETRTSLSLTPTTQFHTASGLYRVTLAPNDLLYLNLFGTPWGEWFNGYIENAIRHGMPSAAAMNDQKALSRTVIINLIYSSSANQAYGLDRNGKASSTLAGGEPGLIMSELSYWDSATGSPKTMNPRDQVGPTNYSSAGWTA